MGKKLKIEDGSDSQFSKDSEHVQEIINVDDSQ